MTEDRAMTEMVPPAPVAASKAALAFIYATVLFDALAFGIIIPVLPLLVQDFVGEPARAAEVFGVFGTVWAVMQFLCSPLLGVLSDRFGRRPVLILSSLGLGLDYVVMALAPTLSWLFVGRVLSGVTSAGFATASAYIADTTPPERRAAAFGTVGAAWGVGFILGPVLGGVLGLVSSRAPFWGAAVLSLVSVGYALLVLPESLRAEHRGLFSWRRANPVGSLGLLKSRQGLFGLASVNFLQFLAFQVLPSIYVLYANYRFGWGPTMVGIALTLVGAFNILVQGVLVRRVIARVGERTSLLIGVLFGVASFVWWGLATNEIMFLLGVVVYAPIGFVGPALQGFMTRRVSPSEQGQLQGANSSIMGLTGVIGPVLFTVIFAFFISGGSSLNFPGAPFLVSAFLMAGAFGLAIRVTRGVEQVVPQALVGPSGLARN